MVAGWITARRRRASEPRDLSIGAAPSGREVASTGESFDSLRVTVDVGAGTVVSIGHAKGP
jgi:hypothetical protein